MGLTFLEPGKDQNRNLGNQTTLFYTIAFLIFDLLMKTFIFPKLLNKRQFHHNKESLLLKKVTE